MNFGKDPTTSILLQKETAKNLLSKLGQVSELNENYQAALSMDLISFEIRLKQYAHLTSLINKTINQLTKKRKTHFNASFIIEPSPFADQAGPYLISKKCPRYFSVLKKMRVSAKQLDAEISSHSKKIGMQPDLSENKYKFSVEEDEKLRKLILEDNGKHQWIEIAEKMNRTPIECVRRNLELQGQTKKTKWTEDENKLLNDVVKIHGTNNWLQISNFFEGKTSTQCFHHWMKKVNPSISRGKWSHEEDIRLATAYKVYGEGSNAKKQWNKIGAHIPGRTDIQCRERYCNILDPALKSDSWTESEDVKLLKIVNEVGQKWAEVAKRVGSRTDNQCWRRWKKLTKLRKKSKSKEYRKRAKSIQIIESKKPNLVFRIEKTDKDQSISSNK